MSDAQRTSQTIFLTLLIFSFLSMIVAMPVLADEMVKIPAGSFKSGPNGKESNVAEFEIDKFEVTNSEYKKFKADFEIPQGKEKHPVVEVSYFSAENYCKSVGKRLPTALEWEKAARGEKGLTYPWGNEFSSKKANTKESGKDDTVAIGSYPSGASPYGVMDASGNVWEWVDAWDSDKKQYRLLMGGSYYEEAPMCTTFSTLKSIPEDSHLYSGFRCAK